jgi:hypothetical protein
MRLPPPVARQQAAPESDDGDEVDEDTDPFAVSSRAPARQGSSPPPVAALREVEPVYASRLSGRGVTASPAAPSGAAAGAPPTPPQRPMVLQPQLWTARPTH